MRSSFPALARTRSTGRAYTRPAPLASALLLTASLAGTPARAQGIAGATWVDQFGSPLHDYGGPVAVDQSDVYATSYGNTGPALLRKYAPDGTLAWQAEVSGGSSWPVAVSGDGARVCVGGATRQPLPGDDEPIEGVAGYVRCFDPQGTVLWTRYVRATIRGFEPQTRVYALAMGAEGVLVAGSTTGSLVDCSPQSCAPNRGSGVFFQKYAAADGTLTWTRQLGSAGHDLPLGATVDASGETDVWGIELQTFQAEPFFESSVRLRHLNPAGVVTSAAELPWRDRPPPTAVTLADTLLFVAAPDPSGAVVRAYDWDARRGRLTPTRWTASVPAADVLAMRARPPSLDVAGSMWPRPGQIGTDAFVGRYRVDAPTESWTIRFGRPGNDQASSLAVDASRVFVGGYTEGALGPGGQLGATDAFVARFPEPFHADAGGPYAVDEGSTVTLAASADAVDYGQTLSYAWDLDMDGTFEEAGQTVVYRALDDTAEPVTVRVRATDDYSEGTALGDSAITIANVPPIVAAGPDSSLAMANALARQGAFTDPGADTWSATVDYGDGSVTPLALAAGKTFTLEHSYLAAGTYTVTVTVSDDDGGTGTASFGVVVHEGTATIPDIIAAVDLLVYDGVLNPGQGNSLVVKLRAAQDALDAGDTESAHQRLNAFVNEVEALGNAGILDPNQAGSLIEMARTVIASTSG